jgi:tetratricopeptide (TPR) repeat protein
MTTANATPFSEEHFKKLIAFLIALVTVFITVVTYLQNDASSRDDAANRDTKRYSLEALDRRVSGDARANFDYNRAYQAYYEYELLIASAEAEGDDAAMARYQALQDRTLSLSPLLADPYFNAENGEADISRYEADTYLVETTALSERFSAASGVKDAWDSKANTYIVHLTLLAVALFLFGMATTISGNLTRWIFTGVGTAVTVFAVGWALVVFVKPVPDLRECKLASGTAIDAYAQGVGLAYQDKYEEAIAAFDQALSCEPNYINALLERGGAQASLGNLDAAVADYEKARSAGDKSASLAGELAWTYYLLGRFEDAIALNRTALAQQPDELWIRFDQGLALLAAGKGDEAQQEYQLGMDSAARQLAEAQAAGAEPPSWLWWGLEDAAGSLDDLQVVLDAGSGQPDPAKIADPDTVNTTAEALITRLKSLSVALEYTGKPPQGELTASISPLEFAEVIYDENGEVQEYQTTDTFPAGTDEVSVLFDYQGMSDGQEVVFKVYIDGEEDPSWRLIAPWELGESGSAEKPISLAYSNTSVLAPGEYAVEIYVDSHLAQRGWFIVEEE